MIIRKEQLQMDRGTAEDEQKYGARESLHFTEEGGLTQFVAHVQTLQPGSRTGDRHWHEEEDEDQPVAAYDGGNDGYYGDE